jgi:hypothetical protein
MIHKKLINNLLISKKENIWEIFFLIFFPNNDNLKKFQKMIGKQKKTQTSNHEKKPKP